MTNNRPPSLLKRFPEMETRPDDFRLLERIPTTKEGTVWPRPLATPVGDERTMVLLDTETTGLSSDAASIIELGMVKVSYSPLKKRLTSIIDVISLYEDPHVPIPPLISELTGITDTLVAGHRFDEAMIANWLADDSLIVAHNAAFDRPFFDKRFKNLDHLAWACSMNGIDWPTLGFESRKLEYLLLRLGWFYEGHRATTDCQAMAWLIHLVPNALTDLLAGVDRRTVLVRAFGAPFDVKEALKARGYRWHGGGQGANKHWWCEIDEAELEPERSCLENLYRRASEQAHYEYKDARNRFKPLT